jgi:hypothetical protein
MPTLLETNLYRVWAAKQSAKGVPVVTGSMTKSPRLAGGSVALAADSGTENVSDGTQFGDVITYLNSITAAGSPGLQADTDTLAWWLWVFHGAETVSPAGTNAVQTLTTTGTPTGGTVPLSYDGRSTTVPFNATAAQVDTALEALPNIGTGGVTCAGGSLPTGITITFDGPSTQKRPHPLIVTGSTGLTGGTSPTGVIASTTPGVNATHTFTPSGNPGFWLTWCQTIGSQTIMRQKHNDGRAGQLVIEASTGSKVARITPSLLFADPGEVYTTDPTPAMSTAPVLLYTEGQGNYTIDGQVFTGQTQFQLTLNLDLGFQYGDGTTPFDMSRGNAGATIGATVLMDDTMLARWNTWVYGLAAPTAGTKPLQRIPPLGSYAATLNKRDTANNIIGSLGITIPGVQWEIPDAPGPAPDSGSAEVGLTGRLQKLGANALYTLAVGNQQAAYTG